MANITVSVEPTNTFTITLGKSDWLNLIVGNVPVPPYEGPDPDIGYQYSGDGPIDFTAKADNVTLVNPGETMTLGDSAESTYTFRTGFGNTGEGNTIFMIGHLEHSPGAPGGQPGPIDFSQTNLTGTFELA